MGFVNSVTAENKPQMEAGVVLVGQLAADYRGSAHYHPRVLPLPYFIYRGPIFKVDRGGVRGEFWTGKRLQLNVSMDGALGSNSDNNALRKGMPELENAVEIGPSLDLNLTGLSLDEGWSLRLPLRAMVTIGSNGIHQQGYLFNPRITWRKADLWRDWRGSLSVGALFANAQFHDYYYGVAPEFSTANRAQYEAGGGYSGSYIRFNLYRGWRDWRFGISLRYDNLAGAVFLSSPLVETEQYGSVSLAVIRRFWTNFE